MNGNGACRVRFDRTVADPNHRDARRVRQDSPDRLPGIGNRALERHHLVHYSTRAARNSARGHSQTIDRIRNDGNTGRSSMDRIPELHCGAAEAA